MTERIDRVKLLTALEAVAPGLSKKDVLEQSSFFAIKKGMVATFNGEICVRAKTNLPVDITAAVPGEPLLKVLRKMESADEITVELTDGEFRVHGKRQRAGLRTEKDIVLPLAHVERPETWLPLPDDFADAVKMVHECASGDPENFRFTCVHLHPKWVEASDNFQVMRYGLKTGVREKVLVRRDSVKHVSALGPTEFSETAGWVHFRNPAKTVLSICRYIEDYPDLTSHFDFTGTPVNMPKGIVDEKDAKAPVFGAIFSAENADDNVVTVKLGGGKMVVRGDGATGWGAQSSKLRYSGPDLEFRIAPQLLARIVIEHNECQISETKLMVDGGKWKYITCLSAVPNRESADHVDGTGDWTKGDE